MKLSVTSVLTAVVFIFFLIIVALAFLGDTYVIKGNIHDIFIPINSGYAMIIGERMHETFHSPFGPVYHIINYISLTTILSFPDNFNVFDIFYLSSILFSFFLVMFFVVARSALHPASKLPYWVLLLVVVLSFQTRNLHDFGSKYPLWYGLYNSHLWGLLILQISLCFLWKSFNRNVLSLTIFSIIQAMILLISANYKVNFAISSFLLCTAPLAVLPSSVVIRYFLSGLVALTIVTLAIILTGYSYSGYVEDILMAARAKASGGAFKVDALGYNVEALRDLFLFVFVMQIIRHHNSSNFGSGTNDNFFIGSWRYLVDVILSNISGRNLIFDILIGLAVFLGIAGDFSKPQIFYVVILFVFKFVAFTDDHKSGKTKPLPYQLLLVLIFLAFFTRNLQSMILIARDKTKVVEISETTRANWANLQINGFTQTLKFLVSSRISQKEFYELDFFEPPEELEDLVIKLSYSKNLIEQRSHFLDLMTGNTQYIASVNAVVGVLKKIGVEHSTDLRIANVEFSNPYPFLVGGPLLNPSYHWVHIGTTQSATDLNGYFKGLQTADIIVVPAVSVDREYQVALNCAFYRWMIASEYDLVGFAITELQLLFASEDTARKFGLPRVFTLDEDSVINECSPLNKIAN